MLALRAKIEEGWALISRPGFSEFLFFRYVNKNSEKIGARARGFPFGAYCFAFAIYVLSRSALQLDQVLTVLY